MGLRERRHRLGEGNVARVDTLCRVSHPFSFLTLSCLGALPVKSMAGTGFFFKAGNRPKGFSF